MHDFCNILHSECNITLHRVILEKVLWIQSSVVKIVLTAKKVSDPSDLQKNSYPTYLDEKLKGERIYFSLRQKPRGKDPKLLAMDGKLKKRKICKEKVFFKTCACNSRTPKPSWRNAKNLLLEVFQPSMDLRSVQFGQKTQERSKGKTTTKGVENVTLEIKQPFWSKFFFHRTSFFWEE